MPVKARSTSGVSGQAHPGAPAQPAVIAGDCVTEDGAYVDVAGDAGEMRQLLGDDHPFHAPLLGQVDVLPVAPAAPPRSGPRTGRGDASPRRTDHLNGVGA